MSTFAQMTEYLATPAFVRDRLQRRDIGYSRRCGDVVQRPGVMAPCVPANPGDECEGCARFGLTVGICAKAPGRVILTIDASTVRRPGERCRMFA